MCYIIIIIVLSINMIYNTASHLIIMCNILNVIFLFNYAKLFSPSEYLILPTYLYILTVNL